MPHFLEVTYGMTKLRRGLPGGKTLVFFVDGDKADLPKGFRIKYLQGFQFPEGADPHTMTVVVDPYVSKQITMTNETRAENAAMKELLKGYKEKKRAIAFPSFDKPPMTLEGPSPLVYRFIVIHHNGKGSVLFIGFDFSEQDLDANFWKKAIKLKNKIHLHKAPVRYAARKSLLAQGSQSQQNVPPLIYFSSSNLNN